MLLIALAIACSPEGNDTAGDTVTFLCDGEPSTSGDVSFTDVKFGESVTAEFSVTNGCQEPLQVSLTPPVAPEFTIDKEVLDLAPGAFDRVVVTFEPTSYDVVQSSVVFTYDQTASWGWPWGVGLYGVPDQDQDQDGVANGTSSWSDCDDSDPTVSPGAEETWYDGVDSNCDARDDFDQDGDLEQALGYGGLDCDDTRWDVNPGRSGYDSDYRVDADCDGLFGEDAASYGVVEISELMLAPTTATPYLELFNTTSYATFDLYGWTLTDDLGDTVTIDEHVVIEPYRFVVLAFDANEASNGGVHVDYELPASFDFVTEPHLHVAVDEEPIFDLAVGPPTWPAPTGASIGADPSMLPYFTMVQQADHWCAQRMTLPGGDAGTPGWINDTCP